MSNSFTNQTLAQIELWKNIKLQNEVYMLPKHLDEKVLFTYQKLSRIETLSEDQADYIGVKVNGPYKPDITGIKTVSIEIYSKA